MNIVIITTGKREQLLMQTLESLHANASNLSAHHFTLVLDGYDDTIFYTESFDYACGFVDSLIVNTNSQGASASRNIGAGSVPRYRRQEHVLFLDDDVYMCKDWDARLTALATWAPNSIISGYSHPYNQAEAKIGHNITERDKEGNMKTLFEVTYGEPLVISSVAMMMPWKTFVYVGPWDEPGGPGGSEDFALCMRARDKFGYGFAVTDPQCVIHTGLLSSSGAAIAGYKELCEQNDKLLDFWNLRGRVIFQ